MSAAADHRRNQLAEVRDQLTTMLPQYAAVLPDHIPAERFARVVLTAVQVNPDLLDCDRRSFFLASTRAATDGLLPDGRDGAIVAYRDKVRGKVAQWMPMVAGLRRKIRQSGEITTFECECVHEKDYWEYERGDNPRIVHRPVRGDRGDVIAAYSIAKFRSGEISREWMWIEEIQKRRDVSKAAHGPWESWFEEMCKKTVVRRHAKMLPMSSDVENVLQREDDDEGTPPASESTNAGSLPPRSLMDGLNHIASMPVPEPDLIDVEPEGETIDQPRQ